jgi:hypothetical protein
MTAFHATGVIPVQLVVARPRCYLVGPISRIGYQSAWLWRDYAARKLAEHGVEAINPLRHTEELSESQCLASEYPEWLWTQARAIVHRSFYDVRRSQAVLANFRGAEERSIGSIAEVAVAYEHRIPVVLVVERGNPHDHPFLKELATVVTDDLNQGIEAVWRLFS